MPIFRLLDRRRRLQLLEILLDDSETRAVDIFRKFVPKHIQAGVGFVVPLEVDQAPDQSGENRKTIFYGKGSGKLPEQLSFGTWGK